MTDEIKLTHTARLAKGCTVTFAWRNGRIECAWNGSPRRFAGALRRRYEAERAVFFRLLANAMGGNVAVADIDSLDRIGIVTPDPEWVGSETVH